MDLLIGVIFAVLILWGAERLIKFLDRRCEKSPALEKTLAVGAALTWISIAKDAAKHINKK